MDEIIKSLLKDHQKSHSEFQIRNFIIGGEADDWARYKQALREIDGRFKTLENKRDELILFDLKKSRFGFGKKNRINRRIRSRIRDGMIDSLKETERELEILVNMAVELKKKIGDIDPVKRKALDSCSWKTKALRMAGIDFITQGRLSQPTVGLILSLPGADRQEVLDQLKPDNRKNPLDLIGI